MQPSAASELDAAVAVRRSALLLVAGIVSRVILTVRARIF
jgi:hypothetical protein